MIHRRRGKKGWFGNFLLNFVFSIGLLFSLSLGISSCTKKDFNELADGRPKLVLEEFFVGRSVAYGIFEDRFGNIRRQFRVNLSGQLDGRKLILDEDFLYDDGERASRTWVIDSLGRGANGIFLYEGQAADVNGTAQGKQLGNVLNWKYKIDLEMSGVSLGVHFDDWFYKQDNDVAINRAYVTKYGVDIGSVTIVFIRGETATSLWPLNLDEWPGS